MGLCAECNGPARAHSRIIARLFERGVFAILQAIAEQYGHLFGPLRLFSSYLFLAGIANALSVVLTFVLLPRLWHLLPKDQGRAHAVNAEMSIGKPMGAGAIFVPIRIVFSQAITKVGLFRHGAAYLKAPE